MSFAISRNIFYEPTYSESGESCESCDLEIDKINDSDSKTVYNLFVQSLLSVGSFHNLTGHVLMGGRFVYSRDTYDGIGNSSRYYKYILDGKTYYLEQCAYTVAITDFEVANDVNLLTPEIVRNKLHRQLDDMPDYKSIQAIVYALRYDIMEDGYEKNKLSMNSMFDEFRIIKKGGYVLDLLLNDYLSFINTVHRSKGECEDKIKSKIYEMRKLADADVVAEPLQQMKLVFKNILDICVEQFPYILLTQEEFEKDTTRTVINATSFELYQENKIALNVQQNKKADELILKRFLLQPPFDIYRE
jgi:hypothetical protein